MARELPTLNPFPAQATTVIEEGSFLESYQAWTKSTPTLPLEPVQRMTSLIARFQSSFDVVGRRNGQAVFVHGEHGSGKTHAIRAAVGQVATDTPRNTLLPLYVKLSGPNFVHAYRLLMAQLSLSELTDIALKFLGSLSRGGPVPLRRSADFQRDPSILLDMFNKHLLERGLLLQAQADRLQNVVQDESNFQRALTYLLEPELKDAAFGWLQARNVPEAELRRLGISGPLESADQCRYGLQLLTLLCGRAGRPLVLILDQAEKFLVDPGGTLVTESAGFLHSLVEAIPDIGGALIVSGSEESWSVLPQDLRQRFGPHDVACRPLQPTQAIELLGLYILTVLDWDSPMGYRPAWPYTDAAVEKLLRDSGGNLRALLQLAWQSFDGLPPGATSVDADAIPDDSVVLDREAVEMSVRRMLWRLGPLTLAPRYGFQYAVALPGPTRLLVRLREAAFYLAEAERAEEDILARVKADAEAEPQESDRIVERYVLIVIGYASTDVRQVLERVYDEVLVYRDAESVSEALQDLVRGGSQWRGPHPDVDLADLYTDIAALGTSRYQQTSRLEHNIAALGEQYTSDRADRRFEELLRRWPDERARVASTIEDTRRRRADVELRELHRVERMHQSRRLLLSACATVVLAGAAAALALYARSLPVAALAALLAATVLAALVSAVSAIVGLRLLRVPAPASLSEAERIARDRIHRHAVVTPLGAAARTLDALVRLTRVPLAVRTAESAVPYRSLPFALRSGDPYLRYGYVVTKALDGSRRMLRGALNAERVGLIRRVLADRLGRRLESDSWWQVVSPADNDLEELPYIVQHRRGAYWNEIAGLDAPVRLLVALASQDAGGVREGGNATAFDRDPGSVQGVVHRGPAELEDGQPKRRPVAEYDAAVRHILDARAGRGPLGDAYRAGLVRGALLRAAAEVDDHELRRMVQLLSPFDGLGAYDHLRLAPELEQLYLFLLQLLYFRDGGALSD